MLGYISSTRKKSCYACVKSKRRCDLGYPYCKRCSIKGLDCKYPNAAPPRKHSTQKDSGVPPEVVIRQSTPDFTTSVVVSGTSSTSGEDFDFGAGFGDDGVNVDSVDLVAGPSDLASGWGEFLSPPPLPWPTPVPRLTRMLVPQVVVPSYLSEAQVSYILRHMTEFVPAMAYSGSTMFLHKNLYRKHEPVAYQDCVALSALYLTKTPRNQRILAKSIDAKIQCLLATSRTWTLMDHLAAVQALMVYQVIRLFDPDLNLQGHAETQNKMLEIWSACLWKRFFNEPQNHQSAHEAFVFNESIRRTVMMSVFIRCAWSCVTRGGLADQVHVLATLPLMKNVQAWEYDLDEDVLRALPSTSTEEDLFCYMDMVAAWSPAKSMERLDPYSKLLLAACRGKEDPRLLT